MIRLTDPDGDDVWVKPAFITMVKKPFMGGLVASKVKAKVLLGAQSQLVRETPEQIVQLIFDHKEED